VPGHAVKRWKRHKAAEDISGAGYQPDCCIDDGAIDIASRKADSASSQLE